MILRHFPGKSDDTEKNDFGSFHKENVVVYARSNKVEFSEHSAPLSIKSCLQGNEIYEIRGVPIRVETDRLLVLNKDQNYSSHIFSNLETVSFCVFFKDGIEKDVLASFRHTNHSLLDNPAKFEDLRLPLFQNLRSPGSTVNALMTNLHAGLLDGNTSQMWLDEQSFRLVESLLEEHLQTLNQIEELPFVRSSTKIEIYKRLCLARDYVDSCYNESITLVRLSGIACLSQFHFLRLFKAAFDLTPHQYLTVVRLRKARELLRKGNCQITEVCFRVGFKNPTSFSRLFKNHFKSSPTEFRRSRYTKK